jgi:hypothetical protein
MDNSDNDGDVELELRNRAYAIWEGGGRPEGKHLEHWHQAVNEIEQAKEAPKTPADEGMASKPKLSRV